MRYKALTVVCVCMALGACNHVQRAKVVWDIHGCAYTLIVNRKGTTQTFQNPDNWAQGGGLVDRQPGVNRDTSSDKPTCQAKEPNS